MAITILVDDQVHRRLLSIRDDLSHTKRRDVDLSDVISHLIDVYQDSLTLSGEHGGG